VGYAVNCSKKAPKHCSHKKVRILLSEHALYDATLSAPIRWYYSLQTLRATGMKCHHTYEYGVANEKTFYEVHG